MTAPAPPDTGTAIIPAQLGAIVLPAPRDWNPLANPAAAYTAALADGPSRNSTVTALNIAARIAGAPDAAHIAWEKVRSVHPQALRSRLAEKYAPATANKVIAAVKGTLKSAWRLELIDTNTYMRTADIPAVKGSRLPAGRALSSGEAIALFAACAADRSAAGARDAAAFALMYGAGLRRSEAAGLQLADYDPDTGAITLIGKGNKERKVYAINGGAAALNAWIAHRGKEPGPLLQPVNKAGDIERSRGITSQALMYRLKVRCRQAAIDNCTPHDLRRSFVSSLLDAGADISAVQTLAGHASTDTTARYDRRREKAARKAADMIRVPYSPPAQQL